MHIVKINSEKNRLYVTIDGFMSRQEAKKLLADVDKALEQLTYGFDVISDVSNFDVSSELGAGELTRLQQAMQNQCLNRFIRVTGDQYVAKRFFENAAIDIGIIAESANSLVEAEQMLE